MVYWTFPGYDKPTPYPNRILVYNYKTQAWAFNDDTITAFGYYQQQPGVTWADSTETWEEATQTWGSGSLLANFKQIIAGNQEGFIFIVNRDNATNAPALQITNLTQSGSKILVVSVDHNMKPGEFIKIDSCSGATNLNGKIYEIQDFIDNSAFTISDTLVGTYSGGGTLERVTPPDILTKEYNFYVDKGRNAYIARVDFHVDKTAHGQVTVDFYTSTSSINIVRDGSATGALLGTSVLETSPYALVPLEATQDRLWHPIYLQAEGEFIQLNIRLTKEQATDPDIALDDFQMHAMTFYATPTASRLQ